jgi:hypothetical protein
MPPLHESDTCQETGLPPMLRIIQRRTRRGLRIILEGTTARSTIAVRRAGLSVVVDKSGTDTMLAVPGLMCVG